MGCGSACSGLPIFTRIVRVTNQGTAIGAVAPGAKTPECQVEFQADGIVQGAAGTSVDDGSALTQATMGLQLIVNDTEEILTVNGKSQDVTNFATLFGQNAQRILPLRRKVYAHQKWSTLIQNLSTGTPKPEMAYFHLDAAYADRLDEYAGIFGGTDQDRVPIPESVYSALVHNVSRWYRVPGFSALTTGAIQGPIPLQWPEDGLVIGLSMQSISQISARTMSGLYVSIMADDNATALVTNGIQQDYVSAAVLCGTQNDRIAPLCRRVKRDQRWSFYVQSSTALLDYAYTPDINLAFVNDALALKIPELAPLVALRG